MESNSDITGVVDCPDCGQKFYQSFMELEQDNHHTHTKQSQSSTNQFIFKKPYSFISRPITNHPSPPPSPPHHHDGSYHHFNNNITQDNHQSNNNTLTKYSNCKLLSQTHLQHHHHTNTTTTTINDNIHQFFQNHHNKRTKLDHMNQHSYHHHMHISTNTLQDRLHLNIFLEPYIHPFQSIQHWINEHEHWDPIGSLNSPDLSTDCKSGKCLDKDKMFLDFIIQTREIFTQIKTILESKDKNDKVMELKLMENMTESNDNLHSIISECSQIQYGILHILECQKSTNLF